MDGPDGSDNDHNGRCELLGPFALFVQGALGALALLSLVWKRARENPQRPLLIWFFDASKQVWGSVLVHIANLLLSMLSSGQFSTEPTPKTVGRIFRRHGDDDDGEYHANPCSFYLLNLAIDTTIGIFILIAILRILHRLLLLSPLTFWHTGITSGEYGDPPKWSWWAKQAIVYFVGLMGMKMVVWLIFALFPWLGRVGDWLLGWTEGDKRVQVFFVMFFFPLVMNAVQYWIIDSYIKAQKPTGSALHDTTGAIPPNGRRSTSSYGYRNRHSFDDSANIFSDEDSTIEGDEQNLLSTSPTKANGNHLRKNSTSTTEYDPDIDGTNSLSKQSPRLSASIAVDSETSSTYDAIRTGTKPTGKRERERLGITGSGRESLSSSMMLLPGSRGPSTPGFETEEGDKRLGGVAASTRSLGGGSRRSVGGRSGRSLGGDDDSTLVEGEGER
ncbi:vacuolar membrane protein-domain-containing protein [Kalaharituber pfeilii]|nr:vacuolar membrane protein-domain-containing protein [Kalaharituber pfeilii]